MSSQEQLKWEGKLTEKLQGSTPEQIWPLFEDFGNIHKYHPSLDTCYYVEGGNGQPGSIRYCSSKIDGNEEKTKWCKEKLLEINSLEKTIKYELLDNNFGIKTYEANIKVMPNNEEEVGCEIEWSFVAEPVEDFTFEGFSGYLESTLKQMVEKMQLALKFN